MDLNQHRQVVGHIFVEHADADTSIVYEHVACKDVVERSTE